MFAKKQLKEKNNYSNLFTKLLNFCRIVCNNSLFLDCLFLNYL